VRPEDRARFSLARVNPFGAVTLLASHPTSKGMAAVVFLALCSSNGANAMVPFYGQKAFGMTPQEVGLVQSLNFGSSAVGLFAALPLLMKRASLKSIVLFSLGSAIVTTAGMCVLTSKAMLYGVTGCQILNGMYFPVRRPAVVPLRSCACQVPNLMCPPRPPAGGACSRLRAVRARDVWHQPRGHRHCAAADGDAGAHRLHPGAR
jgi:hypothetical protein